MWQIELNAVQAVDGQGRNYRIRLMTRLGPMVWGTLLLALLAILSFGGAGLALAVGRDVDTSVIVAAFLFSLLFGATLGAATLSHLRSTGLGVEEGHLRGEVGVLLARGSRLVAGEPFSRRGAKSDSEEDRVLDLLAALERGEIEPREFDAALDELCTFEERTVGRSDRQAHGVRDRVD